MKIDVNKLSYTYENNSNPSIENISTSIHERDFLAIVGHTGSGKSTFIQNLNALLIPTSGEIIVDEFIIKNKFKIKNIKQLRKKIGIVFQFPEYQLFEETVEKDILFGPKNFGLDLTNSRQIVIDALSAVGLDESFLDKSPFELSGGEKRKVAIAGILAFNPDVLIVDEPTAGLDPQAADNMMELFKKLNNQGKTIILVTHQMEYVLKYANRVLTFNKGKLLSDTTPIELFKDKKLVDKLCIDVPDIILLTYLACKKYPSLANYKITSIDEFIIAYKEVKGL